MVIHIRGGFGMQMLGMFGGFARSIEARQVIDAVHVNLGGDLYYISQKNYISNMFELTVPLVVTNGTHKSYSWDIETFSLILKHREEILARYCKVKENLAYEKVVKLLHIRGDTRQFVSPERLISYARKLECPVIGFDTDLISRIVKETGVRYLKQSYEMDWHSILNAKTIYAGFSTFPLSALFINPELDLRMIPFHKSDGEHNKDAEEYFIAIDQLFQITNGSWLEA